MGNLQSNHSSSTQTIEKRFEVFLNFRGIDTRYGFTNTLYEALRAKSIEAFMDEPGLKKGDKIGPNLLETIRDSKISVVIFSKNYASSKWCLRELVEIMECEEKHDQTVIPVFYNVAVSDVDDLKGSFKDGFDQLKKKFDEKLAKDKAASIDSADSESCKASFDKSENDFLQEMQNWREALIKATRVKGWNSSETRPDSKLVDEIVKDISRKLMSAYLPSPSDFKGLYGFEERFEKVKSLLCLYNTDVRIIGIWGMGGIGKTTIANAIFHQISGNGYGKCFILNVRQRLEQCGGLASVLQQEILCKVLNDQDIKLDSLTLSRHIKERLCRKKVFIVLDDVDDFLKLQNLVGDLDRLGPGSRIILTSRNRDILHRCGVNNCYIYNVQKLSDQEALQFFRDYAFKQQIETEDLMALSRELLQAIDGNPLGLKVVSSTLSILNKDQWQSALSRLKKSSEILGMLQISYDGLDIEDKHTFLDIACFYVGEHQDYVAEILGDCSYSLKILFDRSLITISSRKIIQMHDLLQEMGRKIVYQESPNNPSNRSRLWTEEDVLDILLNCDGTHATRGIFLNMSKMNEEHFSSQVFEKMKNLRFLNFYDSTWPMEKLNIFNIHGSNYFCDFKECSSNVHFPNGLSYLPDKLRSLNWLGYPLKALPSNFIPKNLVELNLRHSNIEKLREGTMHAPKLKWIILKTCPYLTKVSDILDAPLLEKIDIERCKNLFGFPSAVYHFNNLRELNMRDCENLQSFPNNIAFPSLVSLNLSGCINLARISDLLDAPLIEKINLRECKSLLNLPSPVRHFNKLRKLNLNGCRMLQSFPSNIRFPSLISLDLCGCINLTRIPDHLDAPLLRMLDIQNCKSMLDFPTPVHHFNNLFELRMNNCENLQSFPNNIPFRSLTFLHLYGCHSLTEFLYPLDAPLLEKIHIENCSSLLEFSSLVDQPFSNLLELNIKDCKNFQSFEIKIPFRSLTFLHLYGCCSLTKFSYLLDAPLLEKIHLENCSSLLEFSLPIDQPFNNLRELNIRDCKKLQSFAVNIYFPRLRSLDLYGCRSLTKFSYLLDAPSLNKINLENCSSLLYFPSPFQCFNRLYNLNLRNCKNLRSFASNNIHFPSLTSLEFHGCINLTKFPYISGNIKMLYLRKAAIDEVPSSIENLPKLVKLDLAECRSLKHISISICKLKALRELNLKDCSALDCFPEILDTMGSLKILDLSGTAIKELHHSIENLRWLYILGLRECKNLEMLPISIYNLTSLKFLSLSGCSKLENLPGNSVTHFDFGESVTTQYSICKLSKCHLCFTNCLNLNKTAVSNIMELLINQHRDMKEKGYGTQAVDLRFCYPGSEVPGWFNCQTDGSTINIQTSGHDHVNGRLIGLAACAVIEFDKFIYKDWAVNYCYRCHNEDYSCLINPIRVAYVDETLIDSDHVALWYSDASILKLCQSGCTNYLFEFYLLKKSPICRVKYCGVCPIYEKHTTTPPRISNESCGVTDQDFGETFVQEQGKVRKFSDEADISGKSNEDAIERHRKRNCS